MAVFRHEVLVPGCSRDWFEHLVAEAHNEVEAQRFENGRLARRPPDDQDVVLVAGRHATKGARYQIGPAEGEGISVTITAWERTRETGLTVLSRSGSAAVSNAVLLRSADRPEIVELTGEYRDLDGHRLARLVGWHAQISLTRWWECCTAGTGAAPALAEVTHPLMRAKLEMFPRQAEGADGRVWWAIDVVSVVGGRSWARPLIAVALALIRRQIQAKYDGILDDIIGRANPIITARTGQSPRAAARAAVGSLRAPGDRAPAD